VPADDRYRLAPLRDSRTRDEHVRRGELAGASADARATEALLAAARARTAEARDALARAIAAREAVLLAARRVLADRHVAHLRARLAERTAEELRAEASHGAHVGVVDAARLSLARARADRQVVERHFEKWRTEQRKIAERRED
jgi:hypothetical protein